MPNKKIKTAIICIKKLLSKYSESTNFIKFKLLNGFKAQTCFSLFYSPNYAISHNLCNYL